MTGSGVHPGNEMGKMVKVRYENQMFFQILLIVSYYHFFVKNETFYEKPLIMG